MPSVCHCFLHLAPDPTCSLHCQEPRPGLQELQAKLSRAPFLTKVSPGFRLLGWTLPCQLPGFKALSFLGSSNGQVHQDVLETSESGRRQQRTRPPPLWRWGSPSREDSRNFTLGPHFPAPQGWPGLGGEQRGGGVTFLRPPLPASRSQSHCEPPRTSTGEGLATPGRVAGVPAALRRPHPIYPCTGWQPPPMLPRPPPRPTALLFGRSVWMFPRPVSSPLDDGTVAQDVGRTRSIKCTTSDPRPLTSAWVFFSLDLVILPAQPRLIASNL